MQICVYAVLAISGIRLGTAVEHGNAGLCLPKPGDFKDSSGNRCEPIEMRLCLPGPGDFRNSSGNRCEA